MIWRSPGPIPGPGCPTTTPSRQAWNKTLKYAPVFPERFTSLPAARTLIGEFVDYYNHHHRHSGIGLHTTADVHYGLAPATAYLRSQTLAQARVKHRTRFANDRDPKILDLPAAAWINQPKKDDTTAA